MLTFIALALFGLVLVVATVWCFKDIILGIINAGGRKTSSKQQEPIKDAEYRPVEEEKETEASEPGETLNDSKEAEAETNTKAKYTVPGSYEKVELHLSSGVDYIEYIYYDELGNLTSADKAAKCKIRECSADGLVIRELWGKPYKNHITEHIRDIFNRQ